MNGVDDFDLPPLPQNIQTVIASPANGVVTHSTLPSSYYSNSTLAPVAPLLSPISFNTKEYKILEIQDTQGRKKSFIYCREIQHTLNPNNGSSTSYNPTHNTWHLVERYPYGYAVPDITNYTPPMTMQMY